MTPLHIQALRGWYQFVNARAWRKSKFDIPNREHAVPLTPHAITVQEYAHPDGGSKPLIFYFHGGGWVIGNLLTHDGFCKALSHYTGHSVIAFDYRRAPDDYYPAAHDDALEAANWLIDNNRIITPFNGRFVMAGDSAGGNLAITVATEIREQNRHHLVGVLSLYPVADHYEAGYGSYIEQANPGGLSAKMMRGCWDTYLGGQSPAAADRARLMQSPLLSRLNNLLLITAERDPLKDEGIALGDRCKAEGVAVEHHHFESAQHGFACSEGETEDFVALMALVNHWLSGLDSETTPDARGRTF